jgi:hypothetical protein
MAQAFVMAQQIMQMGCPGSPVANYENGGGVNRCVSNDSTISDRFINSEGAGEKGGECDNQGAGYEFPVYVSVIPE